MSEMLHRRIGFYLLQVFCFLLIFGMVPGYALAETAAPGRTLAKQAIKDKQLWITADHSKHDILKQDFKSGPEVTKACLSCHSEAAMQFQQTIHWTWKDPGTAETANLGKGGITVNNF